MSRQPRLLRVARPPVFAVKDKDVKNFLTAYYKYERKAIQGRPNSDALFRFTQDRDNRVTVRAVVIDRGLMVIFSVPVSTADDEDKFFYVGVKPDMSAGGKYRVCPIVIKSDEDADSGPEEIARLMSRILGTT